MHAHPGLHEELANLVCKYVSKGSSIVDIGAGAGAFSLRLRDSGYDVTALDVDPSKFVNNQVAFRHLDINKGLAGSLGRQFDAACCIEVIEHIENPWALLRDLHEVVRPGGIVIVSTPHVTNFLSRLSFLRTGDFSSFGPRNLEMGHINPIHPYEFREIIGREGWQFLAETSLGYLPVMDFGSTTLRRLPYKIAANVARLFAYAASSGESRDGWCLAFVLQRPR
jgi:2-polyprenyl-3-methyl-5-hydroxy-6-metoxy-1,4-benzoquinol methylase